MVFCFETPKGLECFFPMRIQMGGGDPPPHAAGSLGHPFSSNPAHGPVNQCTYDPKRFLPDNYLVVFVVVLVSVFLYSFSLCFFLPIGDHRPAALRPPPVCLQPKHVILPPVSLYLCHWGRLPPSPFRCLNMPSSLGQLPLRGFGRFSFCSLSLSCFFFVLVGFLVLEVLL